MFGRFERRPTSEKSFSDLEKPSPLLRETFSVARNCPPPSPDKSYLGEFSELRPYIRKEYANHDRESFDCHSFMLTVARRELRIPGLPTLHFQTPDREEFEYETDWNEAILQAAESSPEYAYYRNFLGVFTERIFEHSEHVPITKIAFEYDGMGGETRESYSRNKAIVDGTTEEVMRHITASPTSRILLISDGRGADFYDAHSSVILGLTTDGKDALVIEKAHIASSVEIKKLSEVVEEYSTNYQRLNAPEINICKKPIGELVR